MVKYIYKNKKGRFEIRKRIGGVLLYWGTFATIEEAKLYRAYYIGKNWIVNPHFRKKETKHIRQRGDDFVIVKDINGQRNYYGTFHNLDDAKKERDICIACNWNMDHIVEFGDVVEV